MAQKKKQSKQRSSQQQPQKKQDSILKEAWDNMSEDFNKLMPEKLRQRQDKKKFVLWLFVLELLVFGVIGKFVYEWWLGN